MNATRKSGAPASRSDELSGEAWVEQLGQALSALADRQPSGPLEAPIMDGLRALADKGRWESLHALVARAKASRRPTPGLDLLRARAFLGMGETAAAHEALKEELRLFPDNAAAREALVDFPTRQAAIPVDMDPDLAGIFPLIRPFTMLSPAHLANLFRLARRVCAEDVPGHFAECGVAAGGSSALLAWTIKRFSRRPRLLYCFDTFEGMPDPGRHDTHGDIPAQETGWGAGTCSAPEACLMEACRTLDVLDIIRPVKGLFADTLPRTAPAMDSLAVLHMDGDWYESTRDILASLYDMVSPRGMIQADDYGFWDGCRLAVTEFMAVRANPPRIERIAGGSGAWFVKS